LEQARKRMSGQAIFRFGFVPSSSRSASINLLLPFM
jgi:hypothetical protein